MFYDPIIALVKRGFLHSTSYRLAFTITMTFMSRLPSAARAEVLARCMQDERATAGPTMQARASTKESGGKGFRPPPLEYCGLPAPRSQRALNDLDVEALDFVALANILIVRECHAALLA